MRFWCLLLVPFYGCASLGTQAGIEEAYECGVQEPVAYCANFSAAATLRADPQAQRAKLSCLDFYREAVRSTKLLCSYFGELDQLTTTDDGASSSFISALGKRLHRKYTDRARRYSEALNRAFTTAGGRGSEGALDELGFEGRQNLRGELSCEDAADNRAPGLLLIGLAAQAKRDQKETFERLQAALLVLSNSTSLSQNRPYMALRAAIGFTTHGGSYASSTDQIVAGRLDEPALLAAGRAELPPWPALDRYYAYLIKRGAAPHDTPALIREVSSGRSLASIRCQR